MRLLLAAVAMLFGMLFTAPIIVLGIPFWTVAFFTRTLCRVFQPRPVSWEQVIEFDPTVGWKPKKNLDTYCSFVAGLFRVKTDAQGWPGQASLDESHVVVFGDSFAFGYGVNAEASFSELDPRVCIKPIGAPGYNMVQELILMRQLSAHLNGKLVVWFICVNNDLYDNLIPNLYTYRMPFVRKANGMGTWEIVTSHVSAAKWPFNYEHNFRIKEKWKATFGATSQSQRAYSACEFLITQAHETCSQAGGRLVLLTIPWLNQLQQSGWERTLSRFGDLKRFNPDLPDQKISEICTKLGIPFVAGKDHLSVNDYIPVEGHWNETGHQRIAGVLEGLYQDHLLESRASVDLGSRLSNSRAH